MPWHVSVHPSILRFTALTKTSLNCVSVYYLSCLSLSFSLFLSLSLSLTAKTIQTAAPAPCTFISTSRHYRAGGKNVRTDKYQRCRKNTTIAPGQNLRDPMCKLFDVVSLFSHSTYSMYIIFDSIIISEKKQVSMYPFCHFVIARFFFTTIIVFF